MVGYPTRLPDLLVQTGWTRVAEQTKGRLNRGRPYSGFALPNTNRKRSAAGRWSFGLQDEAGSGQLLFDGLRFDLPAVAGVAPGQRLFRFAVQHVDAAAGRQPFVQFGQ